MNLTFSKTTNSSNFLVLDNLDFRGSFLNEIQIQTIYDGEGSLGHYVFLQGISTGTTCRVGEIRAGEGRIGGVMEV